MDLLLTDYFIELQVTFQDNRRIVSINDQFNEFTNIYPVAERTVCTACKFLMNIFLKFWIALKLHTDCDLAYVSDLFQKSMFTLGV